MQVEVARASSELILRGLQPGAEYKVRVRVKLDGISYNGYWSAWSEPVFMETLPAGDYSLTNAIQKHVIYSQQYEHILKHFLCSSMTSRT